MNAPPKMRPAYRPLRAARIAEENDRLAFWAVQRFLGIRNGHPDWDDAVQEARMALLDAGRWFDADRGVKFSSYAVRAISNRLRRFTEVFGRSGFTSTGDLEPVTVVGDLDETMLPPAVVTDGFDGLDAADLWRAMARLPRRHAEILYCRFWLEETLDAVGRRFGLCRERVRQVERDGVERLREAMAVVNRECAE